MPKRADYLLIEDIENCIKKIQSYTAGLDESTFFSNELIIDAVVRNFEIIGEASKNVSKQLRAANPHINWSEIIGLRNVLIHEYFGIDYEILWKLITKKIPELILKLSTLNTIDKI